MKTRPCMWCGEPFAPRKTGGKRQRFCSEQCRRDFDRGCRAWVKQFVSSELLPVAALKYAQCQRARSLKAHLGSAPTARHRTGQRAALGSPLRLPP